MERRLGRGLGSLLREAGPAPEAEEAPTSATLELPLSELRPNPHQPRESFDEEGLAELVQSLRVHGVLQPITVRRKGPGYEIVAGERRFRAAERAGLTTIPAVLRDVSDDEMLELALVENLQRRDLDPIERALGFRDLQDRLKLTQEQVAQRVGLKRATVANHVRLLELPDPVQAAVRQGLVTMGHARALLGLPDDARRLRLLERTVRQELSVRALEQLVREAIDPKPAEPETPAPRPPAWVQDAERRMREHLGARVRLHNAAGYRGKITIEYANKDVLERLLAQLGPSPTL